MMPTNSEEFEYKICKVHLYFSLFILSYFRKFPKW